MKKHTKFLSSVILVIIFLESIFVSGVSADTVINGGVAAPGVTLWTASSSPYLINGNLKFLKGSDLSIGPGVNIILGNDSSINIFGNITAFGTSDLPINIYGGTSSIFAILESGTGNFSHIISSSTNMEMVLSGGNVSIASSSFSNLVGSFRDLIAVHQSATLNLNDSSIINQGINSGVSVSGGNLNVHGTSFSGSGIGASGVNVYGGNLKIDHSSFSDFSWAGLFYGENYSKNGSVKGAFNNFFKNKVGIELAAINFSMSSSTFSKNTNFAIMNLTATSVSAAYNFWGDASGPLSITQNASGTGDRVSTNVDIHPWLDEDENIVGEIKCCSSILFIPGMEGSRLYTDGITENQIWEPNRDADVKKLFLDQNGKSINKNVYTRDVIDKTNISGDLFPVDVYGGFTNFLNTIKQSGSIADWESLPYDWRYFPDDVVNGGITMGDQIGIFGTGSSQKIVLAVDVISDLAKKSKTGKVTIVAHSNGGLVAKELMKSLDNLGKSSLVDKVIFVSVPELGAPESVGALLHGDQQDILNGFILSKETAASFAQNAPVAHDLIPSSSYFSSTTNPVVNFDVSVDKYVDYRKKYGNTVNDSKTLSSFLTASLDHRATSTIFQGLPGVANQSLLSKAESLHNSWDSWTAPSGIKTYRIAASGLPTVSGIKYYEDYGCSSAIAPCVLSSGITHEPVFTNTGDSVVPLQSVVISTSTYYLDLGAYNLSNSTEYQHLNILSAPITQRLLAQFFSSNTDTPHFNLEKNVYYQTPPQSNNKYIVFSTHSPVDIDLIDKEGRVTSMYTSTTSTLVTKNIPNSNIIRTDDADYVVVPYVSDIYQATSSTITSSKNLLGDYRVLLHGNGLGSFTFDATEYSGLEVVASTSFENIPVTPLSEALIDSSSTSGLLEMKLDINGDGQNDVSLVSENTEDPATYINIIKGMVLSFDVATSTKNRLLKKLDQLEKNINLKKDKNNKSYKKILYSIKQWLKSLEKRFTERSRTGCWGVYKKAGVCVGGNNGGTVGVTVKPSRYLSKDQSSVMIDMVDNLYDLISS